VPCWASSDCGDLRSSRHHARESAVPAAADAGAAGYLPLRRPRALARYPGSKEHRGNASSSFRLHRWCQLGRSLPRSSELPSARDLPRTWPRRRLDWSRCSSLESYAKGKKEADAGGSSRDVSCGCASAGTPGVMPNESRVTDLAVPREIHGWAREGFDAII
jgi:hypothetical protein